MSDSATAWAEPAVVRFYSKQRCRPEELYESERRVLEAVLPHVSSVADIGCAAGGFSSIFRALRPGIRYAGVDRVPAMIAQARRLHPRTRFELFSGRRLPFPNGSFDLVFSSGTLHHNPDYPSLIREMVRVSARFCVLDLPRLTDRTYRFRLETSHMTMDEPFGLPVRRQTGSPEKVPYLLAHPARIVRLLRQTRPRPAALAAVGYFGKPSPGVMVPVSRICFCVACLVKGDGRRTRPTRLYLDLPAQIRRAIGRQGAGTDSPRDLTLAEWLNQEALRCG